ncbi:hypothetical protein L6452_28591 [Arctium lappa]|uniref:Uncharacterized protein n=1 Tax=Arctium lappa TaxID=4217 RepID=A0ACB8ZYW2_ARCLA|nr:hypothetical protein L6452_28591 [Arctium lappa]
MANYVAFLIICALTIAIGSSMNLPFEPNWLGIDPKEETMMMEPESVRRMLAGRGYISYGAMQKNNVPCNQRGQSYYDCKSRGKANPYSRGCNVITRILYFESISKFPINSFGDQENNYMIVIFNPHAYVSLLDRCF